MKSKLTLLNGLQGTVSALAVLGIILAAPAHAQRSLEGGSNTKIEGLEKIERIDLKEMKLTSYRASGRSTLSERDVFLRAGVLADATGTNLELKPAEFQDDVFTFVDRKDPSAMLEIDASTGDVSFSGGFAQYRVEGNTPGLPDSGSAPELSIDWMTSVGMLPSDESEVVLAHIGGLNMSSRDEQGKTADYEKLVTVRFRRELGGLPVLGASRLVVHLGAHGEMQGLVRSWIDVLGERLDPGAVLDRDAVLESAMKAFLESSSDATSINVETAEVVLYDDGQGVIEPAVHVTATRRYVDKRLGEQPLDFYIPAMVKATGAFPSLTSRQLPDK